MKSADPQPSLDLLQPPDLITGLQEEQRRIGTRSIQPSPGLNLETLLDKCLCASLPEPPSQSATDRGLKQQTLTSSQSWRLKSKIKVWEGLASLLGVYVDDSPLPVSSHGRPSVHVCVLISSSSKDTSHIGSGPTPVTSLHLSHLFTDLISKYSHILGLGVKALT